MGLRLKFEVEGVTLLNRDFSRMGETLSDLTPIWPNVQRGFQKIEASAFKSENARGASGKWKPLSRPYAKQKAQRYGVQPILRATGRLESSLTGETSDTVLFKQKQEFGIGTSLEYAKFHQRGGGNLPKRPVIDFSDGQKRELQKGMQKDILAEIRKRTKLEVNG